MGNLVTVSETIAGSAAGVTRYDYDSLDRVTQLTQTGNGVTDKRVDFSYDPLGQFDRITRYSDLAGTQLVVESDYSYDALNRLEGLEHNNNTETVAFYDFVYDEASRITQITDVDGTTDYTYDEIDQLVGADHSDGDNPDESYQYDANGNREGSHLHSDGYVTGENNRLESDGTYTYEYDPEGNLVKQTEIATGEIREYKWDYRNRLVSVIDRDENGEVVQEVNFSYDPMNRRLSKEVDVTDGIEENITYFVYHEDDVWLEFEEAGSLTQRYLHGPQVDQVLVQEDTNGSLTWLLTDHLGTVKDLVDNTGEVVNHLVYDSYGNVVSETNAAVDTRYLFTGREWDEEIELYYYRARYYDPEIGRFILEDPIGFSGGDANLYRYIGNQTLSQIDPTGTTSVELVALLNIAQPRNGLGDSIYYFPKSPSYSIALTSATTWFYLITEPLGRTEKTPTNPNLPQLRWLLNAPLKTDQYLTPDVQAGGQGTLRPVARSGNDPTIELRSERKTGISHQTPNHENASEIKFLWEGSDNQCPIIPPAPELRPQQEPILEDGPAYPLPQSEPTGEPWWENIPNIPPLPIPQWNPWREVI